MKKKICLNYNFLKKILKSNMILNKDINNFKKMKEKKKDSISIAFLGPLGSYSHLATLTYIDNFFFKKKIINVSCKDFSEIFSCITNNIINLAIVPIYNNYTGFIKEVLILLKKNKSFLKIQKRFTIPIQHCLITYRKDISIHQIEKIFSHPQSFLQCSFFIKKYPKLVVKNCPSSSYAAHFIKKKSSEKLAAIGNKIAASFYNLNVLKKNISNKIDNKTNFLILKNLF
ncbi:prephenate dehydratase domain-containing protein [Enterobacteriaceae endosymbiont of Donacia semicuprea]|uniref:prephenate dehydratase domain-containing protein n=1 Tax=Enterobacteriaceae endosymbiont of Donacia semicuprea TaxID=2675783 RepID=UPI001449911A|nr:prephenate dehydratase domain-containing protein [Enterobacteriaceae endosymbiont of Donacia semicuprea]QJC33103.1 hypothetical protein GJT91_02230 [Enterobacteriaceae endosymbiont of Donacia semicuprea]